MLSVSEQHTIVFWGGLLCDVSGAKDEGDGNGIL